MGNTIVSGRPTAGADREIDGHLISWCLDWCFDDGNTRLLRRRYTWRYWAEGSSFSP